MSISLKKGESFPLKGITKLVVGLGWELTHKEFDLDASVFMIGADNKLINNNYFIYFNNLKSPDGAVHHSGDNKTGKGTDDDESILVNLEAVSHEVKDIIIIVSINDEDDEGLNFGLLKEAFVRIYDEKTKNELARYDLDAENANNNTVQFARLQRQGTEWNFIASGKGSNDGLGELLKKYS